jgi:hypothetical protein
VRGCKDKHFIIPVVLTKYLESARISITLDHPQKQNIKLNRSGNFTYANFIGFGIINLDTFKLNLHGWNI